MGLATSFDLAAVDPESDAGRADWERILRGVLPYVDFFVPSFEELCFMLDRPRYEDLIRKAGDVSIAAFLTSILDEEGPEEAICNAAAAGALCCTAYDAVSGLKPLKEIRRMIVEGELYK